MPIDMTMVERWRSASGMIHRRIGPRSTYEGRRGRFVTYQDRAVREAKAAGEWPLAARRTLAREVTAVTVERDGPTERPDAQDFLAVRAILLGYAVAVRDWSAIPAHERVDVHAALSGGTGWDDFLSAMPTYAPPPAPVPVDGPVGVDFVHAFRGRTSKVLSSVARAVIEPLDPDDAPVVARLNVGFGRWLDVRRSEETYLRPVLSPGAAEPMSVAEFAEAARSGTPWLDDPFGRETWTGLRMPTSDHATPVGSSRTERALAEAMAGKALWRAGALRHLDGVVWRACPEPRLVLGHAWHGDGQGGMRRAWDVTWRCGHLDGVMEHGTLPGPGCPAPRLSLPRRKTFHPDVWDHGHLGLPLSALAEARAFAERVSDPDPSGEACEADPWLPVRDVASSRRATPVDWLMTARTIASMERVDDPGIADLVDVVGLAVRDLEGGVDFEDACGPVRDRADVTLVRDDAFFERAVLDAARTGLRPAAPEDDVEDVLDFAP